MPQQPASSFKCAECERCASPGEPGFIESDRVICRDCRDALYPACPACGVVMQRKLPKSHGVCPDCGERFYMRRTQWFYDTAILNAKQRDAIRDFERERDSLAEYGVTESDARMACSGARLRGDGPPGAIHELRGFAAQRITANRPGLFDLLGADGVFVAIAAQQKLSWYIKSYSIAGVALDDVLDEAHEQTVAWRREPSLDDLVWACFNKAVVHPANVESRRTLYFDAAMFLAHEGREYAHIMKMGYRIEARQAKSLHVDRMAVVPTPECEASQRAATRTYSVDEVIDDPPIPCKECSAESWTDDGPPWCRCMLGNVLSD